MTEAEWLECDEPESMLLHLAELGASKRKARLFGCACLRQVWNELAEARLRSAVEVAERYADEVGSARQLEAARKKAERLSRGIGDIILDHGPMAVAAVCEGGVSWFRPAESTAAVTAESKSDAGASWDTVHAQAQRWQSHTLRDIFGNPFRPARLRSAFRSAEITTLAQATYNERDLPEGILQHDRLAILGDALEDAGCADEDLLSHLRGAGPHVRGCWAVDLILGKG